jgi:hypothetical protein
VTPPEIRVTDPNEEGLAFTWQARDHHGQVATGHAAGAPNTPELSGWRYQAFTEAAQAAITALRDLEAADRIASTGDHGQATAQQARTCDFCAAPPAAWRFPARGDRLATVRLGEVLVVVPGGDWYACAACYLLVEAGGWDSLSERARLPADQGEALWATFRAMRAGPALPLDREGHADA